MYLILLLMYHHLSSYSILYPSYNILCSSCSTLCPSYSFPFSSCWRVLVVLGCLKEVDLVVGLLTYAIGLFVVVFGEVTSLIFPSFGPTFSLLLGESLILIKTFVGVCVLPFLIPILFLVLKYRGDFLSLFILGLNGVLKVDKFADTPYLVVPRDKHVCFGGISISLGSTIFLGLDFPWFPPSFSSCAPPTYAFCFFFLLCFHLFLFYCPFFFYLSFLFF